MCFSYIEEKARISCHYRTHPQGRNAKGKRKRMEREIRKDIKRKREGREGGRRGI
jgi:hypothetical protein